MITGKVRMTMGYTSWDMFNPPTPGAKSGELQLADTANIFLVATEPTRERVVMSPTGGVISRADALNMAAWIVALVDPEHKDFPRLLAAIEGE